MGNHVDLSTANGIDQRPGVTLPIAGAVHGFVKTGQDEIQAIAHPIAAIDVAKYVCDIGLDAAQDGHSIDDPRQHPQVDEVPEVRRIRLGKTDFAAGGQWNFGVQMETWF